VLVCDPQSMQWVKVLYAKDRGIRIVTVDWFFQTLIEGCLQPYDDYPLPKATWQRIERQRAENQPKRQAQSAVPITKDAAKTSAAAEHTKR